MSIQPAASPIVKRLEEAEVLGFLPHRPPMLFVDRANVVSGNGIVGNLTVKAEHCIGHFTNNPIFPGVHLVEMAWQLAGLLKAYQIGSPVTGFATRIENARFRAAVRPGDTIGMYVEITAERRGFVTFRATATVDGQTVFSSEQSLAGQPTPANGSAA